VCARIGKKQGHGGLYVNKKTKHKVKIRNTSTRAYQIVRFMESHAAACDVRLQAQPTGLWEYKAGVHINGKKWRVGTPFFFKKPGGDQSRKNFGTVKGMYHWEDRFASTLLIQVNRHVVHGDGIQFWVEPKPDLPGMTIFWTQATWRCHMSDITREGRPMKNVVRVSTTNPTLDGVDFDEYM